MSRMTFRQLHRKVAPIVMLPLFVTVLTGVSYRISKDWFGLGRDRVHFLMTIHEGEYFGKTLEPVYVLLNGLGVLFMLATGMAMLASSIGKSGWWRSLQSRFARPQADDSSSG
ncbi:hypothetical protein KR51_00031130 [Rubidibacter lacunae KORDI 51-2]|uniref:PepSY-associated TM helix n=1 Tax=Rubidibacter lacunae KORDI 51-2 TaxID=582515 RepID=U5DLH6_9CHRO|nr:hypothetical protein [Rubidibacter lacunae]ERN40565.1 hypothetical protein KR51_00031130 [Rubidibacter lacunae KORDI 51-2]